MKIITGGRGTGKTMRLIEMAHNESGAYIVCRDQEVARRIRNMAKEHGYNINFPITVRELKNRKGSLSHNHKLLFDDLHSLIYQFVNGAFTIEAVSFTGELIKMEAGDE